MTSRLDDVDYFRARALQEQIAATNAGSHEARKRHDELAMMYRVKATMLSKSPDGWGANLENARQPETA